MMSQFRSESLCLLSMPSMALERVKITSWFVFCCLDLGSKMLLKAVMSAVGGMAVPRLRGRWRLKKEERVMSRR